MPASGLPSGYLDESLVDARLVVREDFAERFARWGIRASGGEPYQDSDLAGRQPLATLIDSKGEVLVRRFRHGGLLAPLTGDRYANRERPFEELRLAERLRSVGIATPEVIAARTRRVGFLFWRHELFTLRVSGASDLGASLDRRRAGELDDASWQDLLRRTGDLVGRAHRAGFLHADLHPKNLLEGDDGTLYLIDLDGSRFVEPIEDSARVSNLERFWRWIAREHATTISRRDVVRFLKAWSSALGCADARLTLQAVAERHAAHASLHRTGRRLQRR